MGNLEGYDISPDMVKLSLVNMYLHGFPSPKIHEYDTLTSEEKWDERFDVMMANPPFMTPAGGIRPLSALWCKPTLRSSIRWLHNGAPQQQRTCGHHRCQKESFSICGRVQTIKKSLVEDGLYAVVSLPGRVFSPYSGVKTSILFLIISSPNNQRNTFHKVLNDGFDLGAQRRPIDRNDLPHAVEVLQAQRDSIQTGKRTPCLKG